MRSVFLSLFVAACGIGVALGGYTEFVLGMLMLSVLLVFVYGGCAYVYRRGTHNVFLLCALICSGVVLGMFRMYLAETSVSPLHSVLNEEVVFTGTVVREPDVRVAQVHLTLQSTDSRYRERVLVSIDRMVYLEDPVYFGDVVTISGTLTIPDAFEASEGRTFAYAPFLKARGISYVIPFAEVREKRSGDDSFLRKMYDIKAYLSTHVRESIVEPYAGLGEGILLGVKRAIGPKLEEVFRETGIMHIVVLSGYNILLVIQFTFLILARICAPRARVWAGFCAIWIFVLFVGASPSIVRAGLMASVLLFTQMTGRIYHALTALFLVGIFMVFHNPYVLVWDPGFQLSFLATLGLILGVPLLEPKFMWIPERYNLRSIVVSTVSAQICVLPLLLYHTGIFSIVSLPVNVLVLPMVPAAMLLTFSAGIAHMLFAPLGMLVGFFAYLALGYIVSLATFFSHLPFASVTVGVFPLWLVGIVYVSYGVGLLYFSQQRSGTARDVNEYADWVIEEERNEGKKSPASRSDAGDHTPLPFR